MDSFNLRPILGEGSRGSFPEALGNMSFEVAYKRGISVGFYLLALLIYRNLPPGLPRVVFVCACSPDITINSSIFHSQVVRVCLINHMATLLKVRLAKEVGTVSSTITLGEISALQGVAAKSRPLGFSSSIPSQPGTLTNVLGMWTLSIKPNDYWCSWLLQRQ